MLQRRLDKIQDATSLFNEASRLHQRLLRMAPKPNGETAISLNSLFSLTTAAERMGVIRAGSYSAQGVVFLQKKRETMNGARSLKHIEAESLVGYIARQARKAGPY